MGKTPRDGLQRARQRLRGRLGAAHLTEVHDGVEREAFTIKTMARGCGRRGFVALRVEGRRPVARREIRGARAAEVARRAPVTTRDSSIGHSGHRRLRLRSVASSTSSNWSASDAVMSPRSSSRARLISSVSLGARQSLRSAMGASSQDDSARVQQAGYQGWERMGTAPSKTRTCDLWLRRPTLYPPELWARDGGPDRILHLFSGGAWP